MKFVSFYRREGRYNLVNLREKSAQYIFDFGKYKDLANELNIKSSYLIPIEDDRWQNWDNQNYTALELAEELQSYICDYLFHSSKNEINRLVKFLEIIKDDDEYERLIYYKDYYRNKIKDIDKKLNKINKNICEYCGEEFDKDINKSDLLCLCIKCKDELIEEMKG